MSTAIYFHQKNNQATMIYINKNNNNDNHWIYSSMNDCLNDLRYALVWVLFALKKNYITMWQATGWP